jgi:hypothetical protein
MPQNLANFDAVLKEDYLGPIREQMPQNNILLYRLEKNEEDVGGKKAVVPLHTGRNSGVGARADGGTLPDAGHQEHDVAYYNCAYNYGRIEITGPTIAASRKNKYAFVRAADTEIQGMVKDLKYDINRQLHNDGSGVLAIVNGDSTDTTLTVDNPGTKYLQKNMKIQVVDPTSTTPGDYRANVGTLTIVAKTSDTQVTVNSNIHADMADNDYVVREGSYKLEMMGLDGIISTGNARAGIKVGGIDRTVAGNEFWKAHVLDNGGTLRKLTLDLMQQAWDLAEDDGGEISLVLTNRDVRRKYLALVKADGRYVNTMTLDGGFDALEYNGKPLVVDRHCLPNRIYFIDESTLALYRMSDFDWMEDKNGILRPISGKDAYEAVLYLYATLGCSAPNHNAVLKDIAV